MADDLDNDATDIQQDSDKTLADVGITPDTPEQPATFLDSLPEELRGNEAFKDMADAAALARAYLEAKGNAPEVPSDADGYRIELPDGLVADEDLLSSFKEFALTQGLTPAQAQELVQFELARQATLVEKFNTELVTNEQALRDEWRGDFDQNVELAKRVVRRFATSPEEADAFHRWQTDTGMGSNAALLKLLANVGKHLGEDTLVPDQAPAVSSGPLRTVGGEPMLRFPSME